MQLLGRHLPSDYPRTDGDAIPDPYFSDRQGFLDVYSRIDVAVLRLAEDLERMLRRA